MNLNELMTSGQIAFALLVIAFALSYMAFGKNIRFKK